MNTRRVVVTGLGAVSAYGLGVDAFWNGTLEGRSRIRPITSFDVSRFRSGLGAAVPDSIAQDPSLRERFGGIPEDACFYACLAVDEALAAAGLSPHQQGNRPGVGCVVGTLCAGSRNLETITRHTMELDGRKSGDVPPLDETVAIDYQLRVLCERFGFMGPSTLISTACSSGTDALGWGFDEVRLGGCDIMVVAGGDIISEVIHGGFNAVFSVTQTDIRPFDRDRNGFVIGEGAGAIVLETLESATARGARIHAEILGYGLSNSASHLTAPSKDGSGESLAMRRALATAGLEPDQVDFINAHGTGTAHNDRSEILALDSIFAERAPDISITSIKSMIGHCMGAAGLMEAISTILSIRHQVIPPTINFTAPDSINGFDVVANTARKREIRHAMSNSFGFAGHNSCVVISRAP